MVESGLPRFYGLDEKEYPVPYYSVRSDYKKYQTNQTPIVIDNGTPCCFFFFSFFFNVSCF
jgi:actin-related protein 5